MYVLMLVFVGHVAFEIACGNLIRLVLERRTL